MTSSVLVQTDSPLLPSSQFPTCILPIPTCPEMLPRASGLVAEGLCCPGGLWQSCGEHQGAELPAKFLWLLVAVVVGRSSPFRDRCYWICCREAKPGRLGYKHLGNKDL